MTALLGTAELPRPSPPSPASPVDLPRRPPDDSGSLHPILPLDFFRFTPIPTIILDASLHVCQLSDSYLRVSGAGDRRHWLGHPADDFFDHKVTLPSLASVRRAIRPDQGIAQLQFNFEHKDAVWNLRSIPISINDKVRYFQLELQDVTEEHRKQRELKERMHMTDTIRILVETVRDYAIFMLDPQGNVATWNAGAQSFKGYTKEQIVGKHFSNFYSQEDRDNDKPGRELRDALRDGRAEDEGWRYRSDGSRFWANVVITPVYRDSTLVGFGKVTRDLTDRKEAESRLIAAYEEASKLKSEFLANMSHEIRTPMHGMLSALTLLLDTQLDAEQLELTGVIQESGEVLLQVINDILDYSKLASGSFSISHDYINVVDIIHSVFRAHHKCGKPAVTFECSFDPLLPKSAEGDSLRYRQIVQNLVSNAHKFTETGYIRINAELQSQDEECFTILTEVIDTGIGVPEGVSNALFTPFMQIDNSATKKFKGTGLGLSICKSLSELMGGSIGYRPNPESHGSIFWFTAKLKKVDIKQLDVIQDKLDGLVLPSPSPIPPMEQLKALAPNKKLLVAEDNPINQKVMRKMLYGLGFTHVDVALDGKQAVSMAAVDPPPYHIILMDINMPVLDGISATRAIRNKGIQTPVIAITANALKGQSDTYITKGMTGYIAKPVDRNLLVKALLHCLKRGGGE